jgi:hypothetical protein
VQRVLILILPFAGIIYPLWSLAPKIYYWMVQRRLTPMFRELRMIERELRASGDEAQRALLGRLDDLERRARDLPMPGQLSEPTYNLWANIQALRARMRGSDVSSSAAEPASEPLVPGTARAAAPRSSGSTEPRSDSTSEWLGPDHERLSKRG